MGQKVNPNGFRVGVIRDWNTRWYASKKDFADYLVEDRKIRDHVKARYFAAGVSRIEIERAANKITVNIHTSRPGMLIGKGGAGVELIKADVSKLVGKAVNVNIIEVRNADTDAQLVAENIAAQLEKRISFRRAMKQAMGRSMKAAPRASSSCARAAWAARKSQGARAITRVPSPCRPCAPTSNTALRKRTPPMAASASRLGSTRARFWGRPAGKKEANNHVDA